MKIFYLDYIFILHNFNYLKSFFNFFHLVLILIYFLLYTSFHYRNCNTKQMKGLIIMIESERVNLIWQSRENTLGLTKALSTLKSKLKPLANQITSLPWIKKSTIFAVLLWNLINRTNFHNNRKFYELFFLTNLAPDPNFRHQSNVFKT